MIRLRNEFSDVELVVLGIAILTMLSGWWIAPAIAFYLISRKVNHRLFKIACYVAIVLTSIAAISSFFDRFIYELLIDSIDFPSQSGFFNVYYFMGIFRNGLSLIGFAFVTLTYIMQTQKKKFIQWTFIYITIAWALLTGSQLIDFLFYNSYYISTVVSRMHSLLQFEDYLIGVVIVLLYKDLFFGSRYKNVDEEIYEEAI